MVCLAGKQGALVLCGDGLAAFACGFLLSLGDGVRRGLADKSEGLIGECEVGLRDVASAHIASSAASAAVRGETVMIAAGTKCFTGEEFSSAWRVSGSSGFSSAE